MPPRRPPRPRTVNGIAPRPSSSIRAPSWRSASSSGPTGLADARSSPWNSVSPLVRAATGGTKRITVPALPTSTAAASGALARRSACRPASRARLAGSTTVATPSWPRAAAISRVSLARSGPVTTSARLPAPRAPAPGWSWTWSRAAAAGRAPARWLPGPPSRRQAVLCLPDWACRTGPAGTGGPGSSILRAYCPGDGPAGHGRSRRAGRPRALDGQRENSNNQTSRLGSGRNGTAAAARFGKPGSWL